MQYNIVKLDDYDKAFKIEDRQILCYSPKYFKDNIEDATIVGEIYKYKSNDDEDVNENTNVDTYAMANDDEDEENTLCIVDKLYPVCEPDKTNRLLYALRGYVAVGDDEYIALYKSRLPFLFWLFGILALSLIIIIMIFRVDDMPKQDVETLNPLPLIDSDIVDYEEDIESSQLTTGGEVNMNYAPLASLNLRTGNIDISFKNPANSTHDVLIEMYVVSEQDGSEKEYKIAESGRIPIGSQLNTLKFTADSNLFESEGQYMARYYVSFYNPTTGEKALVNSTLDNIILNVEN